MILTKKQANLLIVAMAMSAALDVDYVDLGFEIDKDRYVHVIMTDKLIKIICNSDTVASVSEVHSIKEFAAAYGL